ncbi:hypothetical protein T03_14559 [Trichinella britovi]|uniref:Uncharacterized protein n=2 Tax=Trichinella TaxID=6333 RepID=A0A0V1D1J2_TRIBR|nr:hypothetical protein T03_14559 [Trichinella britovi]
MNIHQIIGQILSWSNTSRRDNLHSLSSARHLVRDYVFGGSGSLIRQGHLGKSREGWHGNLEAMRPILIAKSPIRRLQSNRPIRHKQMRCVHLVDFSFQRFCTDFSAALTSFVAESAVV